jgi:hypothetical protein
VLDDDELPNWPTGSIVVGLQLLVSGGAVSRPFVMVPAEEWTEE